MPKLISSGATQADADLCNAIESPSRGCPAGGGVQVAIPSDWQARIAAGQAVPGCTYYKPTVDDAAVSSLVVSDRAVARLGLPAIVNALTAPQQAQAVLLNIKLAAAAVVGSAVSVEP